VHAPLLSLPAIFQTSAETIPAKSAYLAPDPALTRNWRDRIAGDRGLRVGLFWRGNPDHHEDFFRSIPFERLAPLIGVLGCTFYSLQKPIPAETVPQVCKPLIDLTSLLTDFDETAAFVANLDLVIGCDSAPAHLAAALGKPTWLALPAAPDWRWLLDRNDSPWYPTIQLFRQRQLGDWSETVDRICTALSEITAKHRPDC
jgi:hypothetical protein